MRMRCSTEEYFGWLEIALSTIAKTIINLNYKFHFTYSPFLLSDYGFTLQQWGLILASQEILMIFSSGTTVLFKKTPPYQVNSFFLLLIALVSLLQPLGIAYYKGYGRFIFYWVLANRIVFGISFAVCSAQISQVLGDWIPERKKVSAAASTEFSWTLADYLIPLIGLFLENGGSSMAYYTQAGFTLAITYLIYLRYPEKNGMTLQDLSERLPLNAAPQVNVWQSLNRRNILGIYIWALLSSAYILILSLFGVWLVDDYGFDAPKVGLCYFFCFTVPETLAFLFATFQSHNFGQLRSAYLMTSLLVPAGFAFAILSSSYLVDLLIILSMFVFSCEIMFVSLIEYATSTLDSSNRSMLTNLMWNTFTVGKTFWILVSPTLLEQMDRLIQVCSYAPITKYGGVFALVTFFILIAVICMGLGHGSNPKTEEHVRRRHLHPLEVGG